MPTGPVQHRESPQQRQSTAGIQWALSKPRKPSRPGMKVFVRHVSVAILQPALWQPTADAVICCGRSAIGNLVMFRSGPVQVEQARCVRLVEMSVALNNVGQRDRDGVTSQHCADGQW
jgi:hypothetical protein